MKREVNFLKIKYPQPLKKSDRIKVIAPSNAVNASCMERLNLVLSKLRNDGYEVTEGRYVRTEAGNIAGSANQRYNDFIHSWKDPKTRLIYPPWGGELLIEILPLIDLSEIIHENPKWIMGYSDTSTLLFAITVATGIATAHGTCLMEQLPNQRDILTKNALKPITGKMAEFVQHSSTKFQKNRLHYGDYPETAFDLSEPTQVGLINHDKPEVNVQGRIIGGCIDTIPRLCGSVFGDVNLFAENLNCDSIIFYLENCHLKPFDLTRALTNMRLAGWFDNVSAVIMGRTFSREASDLDGFTYEKSIVRFFSNFSFPVIVDADIGHMPPQMTIINGSLATVKYKNHKLELIQEFV